MTFNEGQQPAVDPKASLRIELTGAIASAQIDIANAIAELARSGADSSALTNQSQALQQLQRTVGGANLGSLLALRGEVAATASSATNLANQAISIAANAAAANAYLTPAQQARASIEGLSRDLFENRVLDPYLRFNSPEDEEAYRKRERERKDEIEREKAKGTLEGDRNAATILERQLLDAGAHGATASADYNRMLTKIREAKGALAIDERANSDQQVSREPSTANAQNADSSDIDAVLATLKSAGVTTLEEPKGETAHGLSKALRGSEGVGITQRS